jgi:hypothetical protein
MTVVSAKNLVRKGVTSVRLLGPPRFIMRATVLWLGLKGAYWRYGSESLKVGDWRLEKPFFIPKIIK